MTETLKKQKKVSVGIAAHGVVAIGVSAHGVVAIGVVTHGIISIGLVSMGAISFGLVSMGLTKWLCFFLENISYFQARLAINTSSDIFDNFYCF